MAAWSSGCLADDGDPAGQPKQILLSDLLCQPKSLKRFYWMIFCASLKSLKLFFGMIFCTSLKSPKLFFGKNWVSLTCGQLPGSGEGGEEWTRVAMDEEARLLPVKIKLSVIFLEQYFVVLTLLTAHWQEALPCSGLSTLHKFSWQEQ